MSSVPHDVEAGERDSLLGNNQQPSGQKPGLIDSFTNFSKATVQAGFIRKVYGLLTLQLTFVMLMAIWFMLEDSTREWVTSRDHLALFYFALFSPLVFLIVLLCVKPPYPWDLVCFSLFTLGESYIIGVVCALYYNDGAGLIVLEAFILTAAIFGSLSAYALISKKDFNFLGGFLFCALLLLLLWGMIQLFFPMGPVAHAIYCLIGALIFCGFILFDTSRLIHVYGPDQYIQATIELFLDFLNLFLFFLQLLGGGRR